jgi:hypothetical protein
MTARHYNAMSEARAKGYRCNFGGWRRAEIKA